ncbi:winged helix-turn-helix domain-containing protein [Escherichia coli]|nr:winged helix-turn-helix domain-containing protein [Escherichia coli]
MSESALLTSVTLSSQVKNHILNLIAEQKLTPGMPVPSEIQLIQKLGVSRGIVREAYRSLAALGILETHSGKVPRIKKFDDEVLRVVFGFALATETSNNRANSSSTSLARVGRCGSCCP